MHTGRVLVAGIVLGSLLAACGSSGNGWQVVRQVKAEGAKPGFIDNAAVGRPATLQLSVDAKPSIVVRTSYAFICGNVVGAGSPTMNAGPLKTPATVTLRTPIGPPTGCRVNVLVNKSGAASMTVTLRMRGAPTPHQ